MIKFCPECGFKLSDECNFCPSCGLDFSTLDKDASESVTSDNSSHSDVIICEVCGEENDPGNLICEGCGAKLQGEKKKLEVKTNAASNSVQQRNPKKEFGSGEKLKYPKNKKRVKSNSDRTSVDKKKSMNLTQTNILIIVVIAIGIGIVILLASGVFNTPVVVNNVNTSQRGNPSVDLASIQKIKKVEKKLSANPKDTSLILTLAHLKNDAGLFKQAIINYKQYLALVPKDPNARIDMGICYYSLGNYKTAIKEMEQAISYAPKHQIGYLDLGVVNLTAGNIDKARKYLQTAVQLDPASEAGKKAQELLKSHMNNK